jgi:signal transduction histidine kinase
LPASCLGRRLLRGPVPGRCRGWPRGFTQADEGLARALLGPSRREALAQRVESLARSRADVVAAADAERRRIERDLHDGAQQRLVSWP